MYLRIGKLIDVNINDDTALLGSIIIGVFVLFAMMILFIPKGT